jgi:hypothetical protein
MYLVYAKINKKQYVVKLICQYTSWIIGSYHLTFHTFNSKGKDISTNEVTFDLNDKAIAILKRKNIATVMVPSKILYN